MWKSRLAKSRAVRKTAQPVAASIGATPTSGFTASNNSQASAAAVAELIKGLDFVFDQLDFENEPGDLLRLHLERLALEAAAYKNSSIRSGSYEPWTCTPDMGQLLYAACQCSSYIYDPVVQSDAELVPIMTRTPSVTGSEKAACIWKMGSTNTLIVSVRGTASAADHMVNLNGQPKNAGSIVGPEAGRTVTAHQGFLSCAERLLPVVLKDLVRLVQSDTTISRVIFTGHSAGGAASSLIFLHLLYHEVPELAGLSFGLATFGSPPVTSVNLISSIRTMKQFEFALAFVNEHDIVSRADSSYISSIIDLYRSRYGLPTVATERPVDAPKIHSLGMDHDSSSLTWPLPQATFHIVGDIVVLRSKVSLSTTLDGDGPEAPTLSTVLTAMAVSPEDFAQTLFCEVGVHKRRLYLERMRSITSSAKTSSLFSKAETLVQADLDL